MINLKPFCASTIDGRRHLQEPWYQDGFVYATNGHVIVRVTPGLCAGAQEKPKNAPNAPALFEQWLGRPGLEFRSLPDVSDALVKCPQCDGSGAFWAIKCPSWDGDEDGEFEHYGHTYECQECRNSSVGLGWVTTAADSPGAERRACDCCYGTGFHLEACRNVAIGDAGYQPAYLRMLSALPDVLIAPGSPYEVKPCTPAVLTFTGGHALLMPRRP